MTFLTKCALVGFGASLLLGAASACSTSTGAPTGESSADLLVFRSSSMQCIKGVPEDSSRPACFVNDVTELPNGTATVHEIPSCDEASAPCWRIEKKLECSSRLSPQSLAVTVDRAGKLAPASTFVRAVCDTRPM